MKSKIFTLILIGVFLLSACTLNPTSTENNDPKPQNTEESINEEEEMSSEELDDDSEDEHTDIAEEMDNDSEDEHTDDTEDMDDENDDMHEDDSDEITGESMDETESEKIQENGGTYTNYSPDAFASYSGSQPFVLFFHASWCPTCRSLESDIEESLSELHGAAILKADYDTETALKQEYEIRVQHTLVFFNADGSIAETIVGASVEDIQNFFTH
ncbi:MAG: thioredoxin family protein [Anaerolineaceae bacterium]|nr:thioredoxin family protein [Anaerolineaceae bacterium]